MNYTPVYETTRSPQELAQDLLQNGCLSVSEREVLERYLTQPPTSDALQLYLSIHFGIIFAPPITEPHND